MDTLRYPVPPQQIQVGGLDILVQSDDESTIQDGALVTPTEDGGVTIDLAGGLGKPSEDAQKHDANLAEHIGAGELGRICTDLLEGIEQDEQSRQDWLQTRATGISMLGLKLTEPRGDVGGSAAPIEGMSQVRNPLLLEATLRFQANARGELLPSNGPVKVRDDGDETAQRDQIADALERDLNHYLTVTAPEYYPDTDRMLLYVGFGGCGFKKVYRCPIRQRPVSESVDAKDIIISNNATDMRNANRITHVIKMRKSTLRRMQLLGVYKTYPISEPVQETINPVDRTIAETQGINPQPNRPQDYEYNIYECYCELDIAGFEHEQDGEKTGLQVPYRVTIDKSSRQVLEIRRNWKEDDALYLPRVCLVKYPFVPGLGFYDIGLVHILGNSTNALTALWRILIDAGMFGNFPGFVYAKLAGRQQQNDFRVPPAGGVPFDTQGQPIGNMLMPLPYKEPGAATMQLAASIQEVMQRVGGTAETNIGEGKQDAPVGTTLALIEQASKIMDAVHKRIHAAQAEEFQLLKQLFKEDPEALWRNNKKCRMLAIGQIDCSTDAGKEAAKQKFIEALEDNNIVPVADPNTPSHMHRIMKAVAVKQLQAANPQLYDAKAVDERILNMIGISDAQALFAPPQPPNTQPDPNQVKAQAALISAQASMVDVQTKQLAQKVKAGTALQDADNRKAEIASKEKVATLDLAKEMVIHTDQHQLNRDQFVNNAQQQAISNLNTGRPS